jgi:hypothetical protein
MQAIEVRDEDTRRQEDEENVSHEEVGAPKRHLHDFDDEFTGRLRKGRATEAASVPAARPPSTVGLVMLVLTGEDDGDENLLDRPLDGDDADDTQNRMRRVPQFKEPLKKREWERIGKRDDRTLTKNSKKTMIPRRASMWAMAALTDPNFSQRSNIGPRSKATKKRVRRMTAFHTTGPTAMKRIRRRGLGGWFPFSSLNDLTNMYAMTKTADWQIGKKISVNRTDRHDARGASPDSFSEGRPSFFFL